MSQRDPFDDYRRRREIELMESRFKEKAAAQRKRLEDLLTGEEAPAGELEERVTREMEDFLSESTRTAEKMLENLKEGGGPGREQLKDEIRTFLDRPRRGDDPAAPAPAERPEPVRRPEPPRNAEPARIPEPAPRPSLREQRPLGGHKAAPSGPLDLKAALERIRQHGKGAEEAPAEGGGAPAPASRQVAPPEDPRREILDSFDQTFEEVSQLILRRMEGGEAENGSRPEDAEDEREKFEEPEPAAPADAAALYRERIRKSAVDLSSPAPVVEKRDPPATRASGPPPGVTNVYEAEAGEDRDIDDEVDDREPPGWNIPVRPPPPGAWIVTKQKEEGEAALSGAAGDTYLLKKLSQEVRRLNRVYLALLEKGIVTREEVEGGAPADGAPPPKAPPKPAPARAGKPADDDEDEDAVSIEDYDEDRYRPIMTSEKDFSLSSLVQDVHRLKCLRDVLLKKGIVTEKELSKSK